MTAPPETPDGIDLAPLPPPPVKVEKKTKDATPTLPLKVRVKKEEKPYTPYKPPKKYTFTDSHGFSGGYIPVDWAAKQKELDKRYAELRGAVPPAEPPGASLLQPATPVPAAPVPMVFPSQQPYAPPRLLILGGGVGNIPSCTQMPEDPTPRAVTITKTY
jgi:hypothetical protein